MDIIIAAEKPSIAKLLSEHTRRRVAPEEIELRENPDETGRIEAEKLELLD